MPYVGSSEFDDIAGNVRDRKFNNAMLIIYMQIPPEIYQELSVPLEELAKSGYVVNLLRQFMVIGQAHFQHTP